MSNTAPERRRSAISGEQEDHRHQRTSDQGEHQRTVNLLVAVDSREGLANFQEDETGRDQVEYDEHRGDGAESGGGPRISRQNRQGEQLRCPA